MALYERPATLDAALARLADGAWTILAGGTDFYPAWVGRAVDGNILDITGIGDLRGITAAEDHWRIGGLTTWTDVIHAELPPIFDGLKAAAREVGGAQIQNHATLSGNLCNASPAADGVPPLLTLDASVEVTDPAGCALVPLSAFITGNRRTVLRSGQMVTGIIVPRPANDDLEWVGGFSKLGARHYLVISIAMVAIVLAVAPEERTIAEARVAVGACSPVARRMAALEADLVGRRLDGDFSRIVTGSSFEALSPIDDIRANAEYRRAAVPVLVGRLLETLGADI